MAAVRFSVSFDDTLPNDYFFASMFSVYATRYMFYKCRLQQNRRVNLNGRQDFKKRRRYETNNEPGYKYLICS
jgi:hypothetical protein